MRRLGIAAVLLPVALVACRHSDEGAPTEPAPIPNQLQQEKIVFSSRRGGELEIFDVRPDGRGLRKLTNNPPRGGDDVGPAWSRDGRMIAFVSTRSRQPDVPSVDAPRPEEIYVMNADGAGQRRLTRNANFDLAPGWLPDGRIVFVSCPPSEDEPPDCDVVAIRPEGGGAEELAQLGFASDLAVSPDGRRIAYSQFEGQSHFQHYEIHVANLDGSDHRQLTDNDTGDGSPAWSPDGEKIAFVSNRARSARCLFHDCAGYTNELYVMDADGSNVTRLTETPHEEASPSWSPDGTRVVYSRILDEDQDHELWVMNADGSCPTKLLLGAWDTMPDWYGPANADERPLDC